VVSPLAEHLGGGVDEPHVAERLAVDLPFADCRQSEGFEALPALGARYFLFIAIERVANGPASLNSGCLAGADFGLACRGPGDGLGLG
jgi:hypothetical protein